jgi:sec-independent protein translocase protein TatC
MRKKRGQTQKLTANSSAPFSRPELPTFLDHIYELRRRLFWVVAVILAVSSAVYPYLGKVIAVLTAPLGDQQLYYLTPVGGLSFSIKICVYIGVMAAVPFIMFHLYRFLEPLMGSWRRSAIFYVGLSSFFAASGIVFAYFVSLPGALHFLTGLNLNHIQAMLTVDSYLTFVMTYLLGAALLFQLPLLLLIINNTAKPLKPSKLMKWQRYVIVAAFVVAAIISPTPDIMNQVLFALPIIVMYQVGVVLVCVQNYSRARKKRKAEALAAKAVPAAASYATSVRPLPVVPSVSTRAAAAQTGMPLAPSKLQRPLHMDMMVGRRVVAPRPVAVQQPAAAAKPSPIARPQGLYTDIMAPRRAASPVVQPSSIARPTVKVAHVRSLQVPKRTIDGFMGYRSSPLASEY